MTSLPAVRLAGVYAMAGLADDWKENRQTCVDVLCAYLRMPYEPDPGDEAPEEKRLAFRASREVRHTAIRVITAHLKDGATVSWQGLNFDFTGVVFDGGDFSGAVFSGGTVSFPAPKFSSGMINFGDASSPAKRSTSPAPSSPAARSASAVATFSRRRSGFDMPPFSIGARSGFNGCRIHRRHGRLRHRQILRRQGRLRRRKFSGGTVSFSAAGFSAHG